MRNGIVVFLLALLVSGSPAQQGPPAGGPSATASVQSTTDTAPIFRSRSESVLVPVVVLSKHNQHVSGLQKGAFELVVDGKEQTIASLQEVQPHDDAADPSKTIEPGYSNMRLDPDYQPQVSILVLDFFNANQLQRTDEKDLLLNFVSKDLQANGTFSLLCITSKGLVVHSSFSNREELLRTLRSLNTEGVQLQVHHNAVRWTLEQVRQIAQAYAGVPGRKTMVWMSGNIPYPEIGEQPAARRHSCFGWILMRVGRVFFLPTSLSIQSDSQSLLWTLPGERSRTSRTIRPSAISPMPPAEGSALKVTILRIA